jgi:hypothetical protein
MYPSPVCGNSTYPLPSGNAIRCGMPSMMPQSCERIAADQDVAGTILSVVGETVGPVEVVGAWR